LNALGDVEAGLIHSEDGVYTEYPDPQRDEWVTNILQVLKMPLAMLIEKTGLSRGALLDLRAARHRPHAKNSELVADTAVQDRTGL